MTTRLKRHPFLSLFDGADPNASTASRPGTTVPTQALFFLNDPLVHTAAKNWAVALLQSVPGEGHGLAAALRVLLGGKHKASYTEASVGPGEERAADRAARRLVDAATRRLADAPTR